MYYVVCLVDSRFVVVTTGCERQMWARALRESLMLCGGMTATFRYKFSIDGGDKKPMDEIIHCLGH